MTDRAIGVRGPRRLLARLLDTPNLPEVVPALDPRVLHQLVRHCGLEDCGEIVALATPAQLMRIFDDDLWRSDEAGQEDQFDADRFGLWLEVLAGAGVDAAAQKIAEMDFDFVTAALSRHVLVLDQESMLLGRVRGATDFEGHDPLENAEAVLAENALDHCLNVEVGGYLVIAKRSESWDALVSILNGLNADHGGVFGRLMTRCSDFSTEWLVDNGGLHEVLTADEQVMADMAGDREQRREQEGYVTPPQAMAFLKLARQRNAGPSASDADPVSVGYFRELDARLRDRGHGAGVPSTLDAAAGATARPRLPLLLAGQTEGKDRLGLIRSRLRFIEEHDPAAFARRSEELAYLANVLVAGGSIHSRRFRAAEAAQAALAVCNLGLESWRPAGARATHPTLPTDFLLGEDLVKVFRAGWSVLHQSVSLYVSKQLVRTLSELRCDDEEVQDQLAQLCARLRKQVKNGTPWLERDNLDVIAIFDQPSWAILLGLLDECPVVPNLAEMAANPLRVASGVEFISENAQIEWVRGFALSLPVRLAET